MLMSKKEIIMFDIGKRYSLEIINTYDRDTAVTFSGVLIEVALPLIKIRRDLEGDELIVNTSCQNFVSAKLSPL